MQDMMKNLMGDMSAMNWMKDMGNMGKMGDMSNMADMDPTKIGLQVISFQKNAFNNMYNAMQQIQEQTEKMAEPLLKNTPIVPEELKNMLKTSQENFKKAIDDSFVKAESYLSASCSPAKTASAKGSSKAASAK